MAGKQLIVKVAGVGLLAGLIGGGVSYGVGNAIITHQQNAATKVPSGSNKSGGTKINKNEDTKSNQSTEAYNAVKRAVVSVINKQASSSDDNDILSIFGADSDSSSSNSSSLQTASEGSGVIYKKSGNAAYIVTNNHVVSGASALQVIMSNGKKVQAELVGTDSTTDLAVLKISAANVTAVAKFGNSNSIKAGQDVLAIGSPMGSEYANTVTKGIISAPKRTISASSSNSGTNTTVIQTDAAINAGNSGGPLVNMAGQVIGINSMKLASDSQGTSVEGMGFSIPSNEVVRVINQLVANGKITRPSLGIEMIDLSNVDGQDQQDILKLPKSITKGVVVMKAQSGSAADQAGIQKYDVITKINNKKVNDGGDLKTQLYKYKVGDTIKLTLYRQGKQQTVSVKLTQSASADSSSSSNNQ